MGAGKPKDAVIPAREVVQPQMALRTAMMQSAAQQSAQMTPTAAKTSGTLFVQNRHQPYAVMMAEVATKDVALPMREVAQVQMELHIAMTQAAVKQYAATTHTAAILNGIKCAQTQPLPRVPATRNSYFSYQYTSGLARRKRARLSPWGESCFI